MYKNAGVLCAQKWFDKFIFYGIIIFLIVPLFDCTYSKNIFMVLVVCILIKKAFVAASSILGKHGELCLSTHWNKKI